MYNKLFTLEISVFWLRRMEEDQYFDPFKIDVHKMECERPKVITLLGNETEHSIEYIVAIASF